MKPMVIASGSHLVKSPDIPGAIMVAKEMNF